MDNLGDIKQQFKDNCLKGYCLRKSMKSKQCLKDIKQERCFDKYMKQVERDSKKREDDKWIEVQSKVKERDKDCLIEKCLIINELIQIQEKNSYFYNTTGSILDCAHILSRSEFPQFKYDIDNIILIKRIYHTMLDQNINFFNGKFEVGFKEKMINRIMHTNNLWDIDYDYEQYRCDKTRQVSKGARGVKE